MKKLYIAIALVALIVGAFLYVGSQLDSIVKGLIEDHGSAATKTSVGVAGVSIKLAEASGSISRLSVGNPDGFAGNAIEMEDFSLTLDPSSLTSDVVVINDVTVRGARVNILQQANGNNLQQLLRNLDSRPSGSQDDSEEAGKKLFIRQFTLEDAGASLTAPDFDGAREVSLPTIRLRNVGNAENGSTGAEIARQVLTPIVKEALQSAAVQAIRDKASDKIEEMKDSVLEGIFGSDPEPESEPQ